MFIWIAKLARKFAMLGVLALLGALLCATMIRFAPGFGVDERELDSRLSQESRDAIRSEYGATETLPHYYRRYVCGLLRGDLGTSVFLQRPVAQLLKERAPLTARTVLFGLLAAWIGSSILGLVAIRFPSAMLNYSAMALTGFLIALPAAVIALLFVFWRVPVFLGIALVTFPKLYRYQHNLLTHAQSQPFAFAARTRGVSENRILFRHVIPLVWAPVLALVGVSSSMAFGAAIPLEALSDSPGMGQLAWQAALNRDLPLLTSITLCVTVLTVGVNFLADAIGQRKSS
jgi:peptide/nickel transport system permease protein